jgi:hypothetical protein
VPGQIVTVGATALCPHGGQVSIVSSNTRVMLGGQPAATLSDTYPIAGCAFAVGAKPQPCVRVQWLVPAARVLVNKQPVILHNSGGVCSSAEQIPQGPPKVVATQLRVKAT